MARWLRAKKRALKRMKKEVKRRKKLNHQMLAVIGTVEKIVDDFLVLDEAEITDRMPENARTDPERAIEEVTEEMNNLNLEGNNIRTGGGAANSDSN
ncbi:hypothetical protein PTKIN_Ptkin01aG0368300 [Pterospermum kingtungense]